MNEALRAATLFISVLSIVMVSIDGLSKLDCVVVGAMVVNIYWTSVCWWMFRSS